MRAALRAAFLLPIADNLFFGAEIFTMRLTSLAATLLACGAIGAPLLLAGCGGGDSGGGAFPWFSAPPPE
ncbi:hypothetical protein APR51_44875, partial [Variovorax paradoxus]